MYYQLSVYKNSIEIKFHIHVPKVICFTYLASRNNLPYIIIFLHSR